MNRPSRHYLGPVTDSALWERFECRPGDAFICTPPKSGTTWMQTIFALLISGDPGVNAQNSVRSPWFDCGIRDTDEAENTLREQTYQRYIKSHTPADGIPYFDEAHYFCVYRHPLDVHFSMRRHVQNMTIDILDEYVPENIEESFEIFLNGSAYGPELDAACLEAITRHYDAFKLWEPQGNVHFFHYVDMKRDLAGAMIRVARVLGIDHAPDMMQKLVDAATFENMKSNADRFAPSAESGIWHSSAGFFHSGTDRKWEGKLSKAQLAAYDARMQELVGPEARRWLEDGSG